MTDDSSRVTIEGLEVDRTLRDFVNDEVLPQTGHEPGRLWRGLADLIRDLGGRNQALLQERDRLQQQIDQWHQQHPEFDRIAYENFLHGIGYLLPEGENFCIDTSQVDPEIARIAGPQLVVPVGNARYALNAANARWGSLYDALYGTDAISEAHGAERRAAYNPVRGDQVIAYARAFLDTHFALAHGVHGDVVAYGIDATGLSALLADGARAALADPSALVGFQGDAAAPSAILLRHHGLHVELCIDRADPIGARDRAGVRDVVLESAVTTIQDFEDSLAAVDATDKVCAYRNWLGLMNGTLSAELDKGGRQLTRRLNADRVFRGLGGGSLRLPGRSVLLVRNVGHHMMTSAVTYGGRPVPETFVDATMTALIATCNLRGADAYRNSRSNSIYIVKPKMHGPVEVAFADTLFARVEELLDLPPLTLKMGIMDEERRTTVNLKECIRAARHRVVFINTGFLDRTGDEIHTSMEAGPMVRKNELKKALWLDAYERQNVDVGLQCGLRGRAQIGKGMWAMPDQMAAMLAAKIAHPRAGANTAWVPSPTAATLHALHYHMVDVDQVQQQLAGRARASLSDILQPPLQRAPGWSAGDIEEELNNSAQSILGYVVRWVDDGVGCSKVPDLYNVALMEDRATLRISSQHLANWLRHGVCSEAQVREAFARMAKIVDEQNSRTPGYRPMSGRPDSIAFQAAIELVLKGRIQPNGYTEAILHARRLQAKRR